MPWWAPCCRPSNGELRITTDSGTHGALGARQSRQAEAALHESAERFQSVTQAVNDAVVAADDNGKISFWNESARRIFGYEAAEALGQELTMLMPASYHEGHREGFARFLRTGESHVIGHTVELHGRRKDGSEFPLELSLGQWQHGDHRSFTGVIRDISKRKRAERYLAAQYRVARVLADSPMIEPAAAQLLAAIGESMSWQVGGLWTIDADADALRCDATWHQPDTEVGAFLEMTKALALERGIGLPGRVWEHREPVWIPDATIESNFPRADAARAGGLHGGIAVPVRGGGEFVGVLEFFSPQIQKPDQELVDMMATIGTQVGEFIQRKRAESALAATAAELRLRAGELERSNADLEQFAYVASHDLSEPLRMVSGFVQLLAKRYEGRLDDDADEFIGYAVDGVDRMQGLIDDLLAFSRVGRGDRELAQVDTDAAARRALHGLGGQVAEAGATVEIGELPEVRGDERELTQLFQNLISNGLKFSGAAPPEVRVSAEREQAPGAGAELWRFSVADNGIGVEPRHAERIFKMFQRLHGRDDYPGSGIGLALCKKIVERHDGRIWVEPNPGGGSVFKFTLATTKGGTI